ncbi:MAG TPA: PilZ domain-containing protein [Steroidobacteraceae bacterium]|nr:PilZ domain-containing protein [Steroidobacteraceae bacterium]
MFDGADTIVLYEELAYQDVLPVLWRALPGPVDQAVAASFTDRNLRVLQACAAIEDHAKSEKPDEDSPELQRLDFKINLLLDLVGQLVVANRPRPPVVPIRFNALGAVWRSSPPLPEAGTQGVAEIYLRDFLAEPLRLIGRITNVSPDGQIKARFNPTGETIADLIEKLTFRRHRRQIAESRHRAPETR